MEDVTRAAAAVTSVDFVPSLDGAEDAVDISDGPSLVSAMASVVLVVKVVNSPGSASLFSLLPFVSISIFVDDSVFSIIGVR